MSPRGTWGPWLASLLLACGCGGPAARNEPLSLMDRSRPIVVRVRSAPSGARVFETGPDGRPGALLGRTPLRFTPLELQAEAWSFSPTSGLVKEKAERSSGTLAEHLVVETKDSSWSASQGEDVCLDLTLTRPGYLPARLIRCIRPEELPALFSRPVLTLRAELRKEEK